MTITRKILLPILFVIILVGATLIVLDYTATQSRAVQEEQEDLARLSEVFTGRLDSLEAFAVGMALEIANNPEVQAAFAAHDRERLIELTLPAYEIIDAEFDVPQAQFHLPPAISFLRLHQLENYGDDLSAFRFTVLDANIHKTPISGLEIGRGGLGMRGVVPVEYQSRYIGTFEFGLNVDQTLIDSLKEQFNADWQLLLSRGPAEIATFLGSTSDVRGPMEDLLLQASTLAEPFFAGPEVYQKALQGEPQVSHVQAAGKYYAIYSMPLLDFRGNIIGVLDIVTDRTLLVQQQNYRTLLTMGAILLAVLFTSVSVSWVLMRTLKPIGALTEAAQAISAGDLRRSVQAKGNDELAVLANAFNSMTAQLSSLVGSLEQRVSERLRDIKLAAEVSQSISQVKNVNTLLADAVEIIRSHFDLYYVQIYLVDQSEQNLVLRAGTGAIGEQLLQRGHHLALNVSSINGKACIDKRPVLVTDTAKSGVHRPNPLLPDTRSEVAVPLMIGHRVVGVLDLQANQPETFQEENLFAFQTVANQLAIALENANLFEQAEKARLDVEAQMRRQTRQGWQEFLDAVQRSERIGFAFNMAGVTPLEEPLSEPVSAQELEVPITIAGEPVGRFRIESEGALDAEDAEFVSQVARQVGEQIQNLRLLAQAEQYRQEAEEVVQRLTREGWESYQRSQQEVRLGFVYDQQMVSPLVSETNGYHERASLLPLQVRGEQIGELGVVSENGLDEESQELMQAVARQLSTHLENLRLLEETRRTEAELATRAAEMMKVAELATHVTTQTEVDELLQSLVDQVKESFGLYHAHIYLLDEKGERLNLAAGAGEVGRKMVMAGWQISATSEKSLVARAARTRQAVIVNDVRADPEFLPNELLPETRSEMAVPLVVGNRVLGVLDVQSDQVEHFTAEDASIQTTLASQVAVALQNAQQYRETQAALEKSETLYAITRTATRSLELNEILSEMLTQVLRAAHLDMGLISMVDPATGELALAVHHAMPEPLVRKLSIQGLKGTLCAMVYNEQRAISINDLEKDSPIDASGLLGLGIHAYQGVPLEARGKVLGTLCAFAKESQTDLSQSLELMQIVGQQVGIAIENAQLFQRTQQQAEREASINMISQRIQATTSVEEALQVAVRELGRTLGAQRATIQLGVPKREPSAAAVGAGNGSSGNNGKSKTSQ